MATTARSAGKKTAVQAEHQAPAQAHKQAPKQAPKQARRPTVKSTPPLPASRSRPAENTRPGSERQQSYLMGVVYDLIAEHGIDALTMRQVAAASGVSTGTINYHFKNKENLVISALESAYQLPGDWEEYQGSPAAQLKRLALSYAFKAGSNRWWRFWINYLATSTRDEELQAHQEVRFDKQLLFWSELVTEGVRLGEFRKGLDAQEAARELLVTVHGLLALQFMKPDAKMRNYARERILHAIDGLMSAARQGKAAA